MRRAVLMAAFLMILAPAAMAAKPQAMSGEALRKAVSGQTVYLKTEWGVRLPISYNTNGTMTGRLRALVAAMAGGASRADSGKWWIAKGALCQRWSSWLDGKAYCYTLTRQGDVVHWRRNDGRKGTASFAR